MGKNSLLLFVSTSAQPKLVAIRARLTRKKKLCLTASVLFIIAVFGAVWLVTQIGNFKLAVPILFSLLLVILFSDPFFESRNSLRLLKSDLAAFAAEQGVAGVHNTETVSPLSLLRSAAPELDGPSGFVTLRESITALYNLRRQAVLSGNFKLANELTDRYLEFYSEATASLGEIGLAAHAASLCQPYVETNKEIGSSVFRLTDQVAKHRAALETLTNRISITLAEYTRQLQVTTAENVTFESTNRKGLESDEQTWLLDWLRAIR